MPGVDAPEQETALTAEQQSSVSEQVAPVADATTEAVAHEGAPANLSVTFDLSTDEGIRAAIEANPNFRGYIERERSNGENRGRQLLENEYKRDRAASERVEAVAKQMYERLGVELAPDDLATLRALTRANSDAARLETMRALATEAKALASDEEATLLQTLIDSAEGNAEEMEKVAAQAVGVVTNKAARAARDGLSFDELITDSRLREQAEAYVQKLMAEEAEAKRVEQNTLEQAPDAPPGTAGNAPMTRERLQAMAPDQRLAYFSSLSDEDRARMWELVA